MSEPADQAARERFRSELERNYSVVASAGSGKTRAITDRIVEIARSPHARELLPNLVVVTFTNRAADEMQQRARQQIFDSGVSLELIAAFNRAFFGTIHSFCVKLLGEYGYYLGLPGKLDLVTDDDDLWNDFVQRADTIGHSLSPQNRALLLRHVQVRDLMELGRRANLGPALETEIGDCPDIDLSALRAFVPDRRSQENIERIQTELREWEEAFRGGTDFLPLPRCTTEAKRFVKLWRDTFGPLRKWLNCCALFVAAEVERAYREFRLERGALTYNDQVVLAGRLFANPEAARRIRAQNYRVILDEAQDTDPAQFSVLLETARPVGAVGAWPECIDQPPRPGHFCMVGDFQQSIFGERANLSHYRRIHEALVQTDAGAEVKFSVTFRLDQKEIDLINKTFRQILHGRDEQVEFVELHPRPDVLPGQVIRLNFQPEKLASPNESKTPEWRKAEWAAAELASWIKSAGLQNLRAQTWSDVAILCPRKHWLRALREALRHAGFAVQIQSETDLRGDSPAYAWLAALAQIMTEPLLSYEIVGVLREVFGISDHDLAVFSEGRGERFQIERESRRSDPVARKLNLLAQTRADLSRLPLFSAMQRLVEKVQLRERLASLPADDFEHLDRELDQLLASAATTEADGMSLSEFAKALRLNFLDQREVQTTERNAIQLITSQKAKGSEWQAVIVPFLSRQIRNRSPRYPGLIRVPATGEILVTLGSEDRSPEIKKAMEESDRQGMERLLYVALTRARHTLVLASEGDLFKTARGETQSSSQMKWLRCDTGDCNEVAFASLSREALACAETDSRQQSEASRSVEIDRMEKLPRLTRRTVKSAQERAADFVRKANPSGITETLAVLEASGQDLDDETISVRAPVNFDNAATRYGTWWHSLAQRIPWMEDVESWNTIFDASLPVSPDPARSAAEWKLLRQHVSGPSDFRRRVSGAERVLRPEVPFLWKADAQTSVEGIIDLALFYPKERRCLIIDWKTNRVSPGTVRSLGERYRTQLAAYWKAVGAITGMEVEAGLFATGAGEFILYDGDELEAEWGRLRALPPERLMTEISAADENDGYISRE